MVLGKRKRIVSGRRYSKRVNRRSLLRSGISRGLRVSRNPTYSFVRTVAGSTISTQTASATYGAMVFKLSDLDNYTEFTNLFDRYRICGIKVTFEPNITGFDANAGANAFTLPMLLTAIDHNDSATPGSMAELMQYRTLKKTRAHVTHSRYFKPAVLTSAYESAVATAYIPKWKQWLTCDDPATPHYAIKYGISAYSDVEFTVSWRTYIKFYFQTKDLK